MQTNGPWGGCRLACLAADGANVYVASQYGGVFRTTDNGTSWNKAGLTATKVTSLVTKGTALFAGTYNAGVRRSTDAGASWEGVNAGLPVNATVTAITAFGEDLFAFAFDSRRAHGCMYRSTDDGTSWTAADSVIGGLEVHSFAAVGSALFAGTINGGVYRSTDNGQSWEAVNSGIPGNEVDALLANGTTLFAGLFFYGLYRSTDNGASWTEVNNGLPVTPNVSALSASGADVFVFARSYQTTGGSGVFHSTDDGDNWTSVSDGLTVYYEDGFMIPPVNALLIEGSNMFAATTWGGVYRTTDSGTSWTQQNGGLAVGSVSCIATVGDSIFAGTNGGGVFLSTDMGDTWSPVNNGLTNTYVLTLAADANHVIAGTNTGGAFLSTDEGATWTPINSGLSGSVVASLFIDGSDFFAGTMFGGISRSTNGGSSWTRSDDFTSASALAFASNGSRLFAGTAGIGVLMSSDNGTSWSQVNNGLTGDSWNYIYELANVPDGAGGSDLFAGTGDITVFGTTDDGADWTMASNGLPDKNEISGMTFTALAALGSNILAGIYGAGVYTSTDKGSNWSPANAGLAGHNVTSLAISSVQAGGEVIYAGTDSTGVWRLSLSDIPLGVEGVEFKATASPGCAVLTWRTRSELNNLGFNICRRDLGGGLSAMISSYKSNKSLRGLDVSAVGRTYSYEDRQVIPGHAYEYTVESVASDGTRKASPPIQVSIDIPREFCLYQNYPNPFNPTTKIEFDLKEKSSVTIEIYDVLGRRLQYVDLGEMNAGTHEREVNMSGYASGVYYYRFSVAGRDGERFTSTMKMVVAK